MVRSDITIRKGKGRAMPAPKRQHASASGADEGEKLRLIALNLDKAVGPLAAAASLHRLYGGGRGSLFARASRSYGRTPPDWPALGPHSDAPAPTTEALEAARREWEAVKRWGGDIVTWIDDGYPANLRTVLSPPPVLYYRGSLSSRDWLAVAIVGTRRATGEYAEFAATLGYELAKAGVTVVSGLARGIDRAAHEGALAANGRTLAVLGTGVDVTYPKSNARLAEAIVERGALLSFYPLGTPPLPHHFPSRNWVIAGLSLITVVVQCGRRSGALITARYAAAQGRDVMAVPGPVSGALSEGPNELLRDGAGVVLCAADVLAALRHELRFSGVDFDQERLPFEGAAPATLADRIKSLLREEITEVGILAQRLGEPVENVQRELVLLEIAGEVASEPGGRVRLANRTGRSPSLPPR